MGLRLGDTAPDFTADTTQGKLSFHEWLGDSWGVLFSHPKDFTPVCTTELGYMARINPEFERTDVALVIGANDVVNPAARSQPDSPLYGMPILDVDRARHVIVMKRSMNPGFAGVDNELFYRENTRMLFGDAKKSLESLVRELKAVPA